VLCVCSGWILAEPRRPQRLLAPPQGGSAMRVLGPGHGESAIWNAKNVCFLCRRCRGIGGGRRFRRNGGTSRQRPIRRNSERGPNQTDSKNATPKPTPTRKNSLIRFKTLPLRRTTRHWSRLQGLGHRPETPWLQSVTAHRPPNRRRQSSGKCIGPNFVRRPEAVLGARAENRDLECSRCPGRRRR